MLYSLDNVSPQTQGDDYYVADTATVLGNVILEKDASVWFGAVVRGDTETITIGERSNVQDCSVLHADTGFPLVIGSDVTIGHKVMLHGCTIGAGSLIAPLLWARRERFAANWTKRANRRLSTRRLIMSRMLSALKQA